MEKHDNGRVGRSGPKPRIRKVRKPELIAKQEQYQQTVKMPMDASAVWLEQNQAGNVGSARAALECLTKIAQGYAQNTITSDALAEHLNFIDERASEDVNMHQPYVLPGWVVGALAVVLERRKQGEKWDKIFETKGLRSDSIAKERREDALSLEVVAQITEAESSGVPISLDEAQQRVAEATHERGSDSFELRLREVQEAWKMRGKEVEELMLRRRYWGER